MSRSAASLRRLRLGLGLGLAALFALGLLGSAGPARADDERDKQVKEIEKQLDELNKKLAKLKAEKAKTSDRKPLTLKDLTSWKSISRTALSRDGTWFAYVLSRTEGKGEIVVRQTSGDKEHRAPADMVFGLSFSKDGRWLAYSTMDRPATGAPRGKGGKGTKGPATTPSAAPSSKVVLLRLDSGKKTEYEGATRFAFAGETANLAIHRPASRPASPLSGLSAIGASAVPQTTARGSDLVLLDPATGKELVLGNVAEFGFDKKGQWLALVIDAQGQAGNGVQLRDMKTGALHALESSRASYQGLNWTEKGDAFAVLCTTEDKAKKEKRTTALAFTNLGSASPTRLAYDPSGDSTFPKGMSISTSRSPSLSEDLGTLFFGIQVPPKPAATPASPLAALLGVGTTPGASDKPDLVIWHGKDPRLQSQQQVEAGLDQGYSYLCAYRVADKKFHRLADDTVKQVMLAPKGRYAVGLDDREHEHSASLDGRRLNDVYVTDVHTGKRQPALKGHRYFAGLSPDGKHFLYYEDGHFHVMDMATMSKRNITKDVPTSFINTESDHNIDKPPTSPQGWAKDGSAVLISDNWDVWKVPVGEGSAVNLTANGKKGEVRYRFPKQFDPEAKGLDLSAPIYFSTYGEWTKKSGFARVETGKPVAHLCFDDAHFEMINLAKARDADTFVFTRETAAEYPDYYLTGADFKEPKRLTTANPEQEKFAWSAGSKLIEYESNNKKKERLQASLLLPAGYEPGKKYPTVVYIYEKLSEGKNRYLMPRAMGFNPAYYTSNGYAVLMPDIKYRLNDPGLSAVECVLPALKAAIKDGVVDKDKVGLQGHSWGGYQTAFLITQTDDFKAAVAGAPLTNLVSMYSLIYKNRGIANQPIFESSQGRFTGPYTDLLQAYMRNSPVFHAKNVKTPLMLLHNDQDGAVDFTQGVEYFNTLRRLKKPVVMLQYKGENHGLVKPANQKDYAARMKEFFDHHLQGKPAPGWLKDGVPHLKMGDHLDERSKKKD